MAKRTALEIRIVRKLHPGISGATDDWDEMETFKFGPRNGYRAYEALRRIRRENVEHYGSIGCGSTRAFVGAGDVTEALTELGEQARDCGWRTLDCSWLIQAAADSVDEQEEMAKAKKGGGE